MSYFMTKQNDDTTAYVKEFIADSLADLNNIPVDDKIYAGSTCLIADIGAIYILNASKQWVEL